jgi:chaperonin GroEL (HSP60 family)
MVSCQELLPAYVPGGGAVEEALSIAVRNESLKYPGKEQIAIQAFANSLEVIPILLTRNSGLDSTDITELRAKHVEGMYEYGIDVFSKDLVNVIEAGLIEPLVVKEQVLKTCAEVASTIIRINDVIDRRYAKRHRREMPKLTKGLNSAHAQHLSLITTSKIPTVEYYVLPMFYRGRYRDYRNKGDDNR